MLFSFSKQASREPGLIIAKTCATLLLPKACRQNGAKVLGGMRSKLEATSAFCLSNFCLSVTFN